MRGVYTANHRIAGINTDGQTLLMLLAPSSAAVEIISAKVTSEGTTNQQLTIQLRRVTSAGSGGSSVTPRPEENGDQAAGSTVTGGTFSGEPTPGNILEESAQNALAGWRFDPVRDERPTVPPSGRIALVMSDTPTSFDGNVMLTFREIG